jgi:hypothetical protein
LTRLAGQYAREKQEILRDLRNYRAAESPESMRLGGQLVTNTAAVSAAPSQPPRPPEPPKSN